MNRILVTGGCGFVGLRVVAALLRTGRAVRVLDLAPRAGLLPADGDVETVAADVTDPAAVARAAEGCSGILHLAGLMTVDCARDPILGARVNLIGSLAVFEAARKFGLPVGYLSTAGVFGPADAGHPAPATIYGTTKLAVEGAARAYAQDHGVPSLGLRPYIVYGPGISAGIAAGPSIAIAAAARQQPAVIRFSGRAGFVFVDDVAGLLVRAMGAMPDGATVLTMAGETMEMAGFVAELARQTGCHQIGIEGAPLRIPGDLRSDPLPAALDGGPPTGVAEGIALTLAELRRAAATQ